VPLRQSYRRVAKRAALMVGRYIHAQFKWARRALKFLRVRLGRVIRDIRRKIAGDQALQQRFADWLALAVRGAFAGSPGLCAARPGGRMHWQGESPGALRVRLQEPAPVKAGVSVATPVTKPRGASLCCTPRHCTATPLMATPWRRWLPSWKRRPGSRPVASTSTKAFPCEGRGLSRPHPHPEVPRLDQRPGAPPHCPIRREMCRRAAVKPVIGHMKAEPDGPQLS